MFRDRDRRPLREMVMWAGEFAGKYLTAAVQVLRLTGDRELREVVAGVVAELVSLQAENGYLGPWPSPHGLTNRAPNCRQGAPLWEPERGGDTWDAWGHYHVMCWHADSGDAAALRCARRMADRLCEMYLGAASPRLVDTGWSKVNLAPAHSLALLHRVTGEARYLQLAEQLVAEFAARDSGGQPLAGNYVDGPLSGLEYFELPNTGWESLHSVMALAELYPLTSNMRYRDALQRIWWSVTATDRHNNGGFSSGEMAVGDPYDLGAIETCCTIAWIALSVEMLRLTGDALVADEIELSTLNAVLGLHSASGRWVTYDTPPDGRRIDSGVTLGWQGREGSPELNCCSVNGARGLGMVSDWALMKDAEGLLLNWYGPSELRAPLRESAVQVTLRQHTRYPVEGRVALRVAPSAPVRFRLKLRIPRWSRDTTAAVNGTPVGPVEPGAYLAIERTWRDGDLVDLDFDLSVHCWPGHNARAGTTSLYRGPLLLAFDARYNDVEPDALPALDARRLRLEPAAWPHWLPPVTLLQACGEAHALIAASPDTSEARSLAAALERIEAASDIIEPSLGGPPSARDGRAPRRARLHALRLAGERAAAGAGRHPRRRAAARGRVRALAAPARRQPVDGSRRRAWRPSRHAVPARHRDHAAHRAGAADVRRRRAGQGLAQRPGRRLAPRPQPRGTPGGVPDRGRVAAGGEHAGVRARHQRRPGQERRAHQHTGPLTHAREENGRPGQARAAASSNRVSNPRPVSPRSSSARPGCGPCPCTAPGTIGSASRPCRRFCRSG